jgi:site-specific DNA-cytosine methylase
VTDYVHQLTTGGGKPGEGYAAVFEPSSAFEENWHESEVKNALRAGASKSSHVVLAFSAGNSADARSIALTVDATPPLRAAELGTNQVPTIAYNPGVVGPLTASGMSRARGTESIESAHVLAFHPTQDPISGPVSPTLGTTSGGMGVHHAALVRRLTPLECERLMGWPDDHTRWRADGREVADSLRYRMCGNGVVANVAEWIGGHLLAAMNGVAE